MLVPADTLILGALVTPALAAAGAAAMAAPILIHLLARRRFRRIRWAAMDFLLDAEQKNRRRIQMEDWILMALRALAVLLVGLLLSRPFFTSAGLAAWAGSQRTERVIVLDDSFSMGYRPTADGPSRFDRAKQAVQRTLRSLHEQAPDDTVTILRTSAPDNPVVSGGFLEQSQMNDTLARVEALSASQRSMEISTVFRGVVDALERDTGILAAVVYVVSDFQRVDWAVRPDDEPSGATESAGGAAGRPAEELLQWADEDKSLRAVLVNVGEPDASNAAVASVSVPSGQVVAGTEGLIRVELVNHGDEPLANVVVRTTVGNRPDIARTIPTLAARQTVSLEVEGSFLRAGDESVRVDLSRDGLELDDTRHLAVPVVSALRVLVVNGEPSPDSFDDETALFVTALRPEGEVFSGFEPRVITESDLDEVNFGDVHVVVLANVFRVSDPAVEALEHYVRQGGGLLIFLGDQIDADVFNTTFYRSGEGLAPAELVEPVRPASAARLVITDRSHPALRGVGRAEDPLGISQVPFTTFIAAEPHESPSQPGGDAGPDDPGRAAGSAAARREKAGRDTAARFLARFDDPDERPAMIERDFGDGRTILITTSADKEWNLWPNHPTYLPIMMELVSHLARSGAGADGRLVGAPVEVRFDPSLFSPEVTLRPPGFPNEPEAFVTAVPAQGGLGLVARWQHTETSGNYQFLLRGQGGGDAEADVDVEGGPAPGGWSREQVKLVAVNPDPRESDLRMAEEAQIRTAMGDLPFEYVHGLEQLAAGTDEARTELWVLCLIGVVAVLMTEQALAFMWGRRR